MSNSKKSQKERDAEVGRDNTGNIFTGDIQVGGDFKVERKPVSFTQILLAVASMGLLFVAYYVFPGTEFINNKDISTVLTSFPTPTLNTQHIIAPITPIPSDEIGILIADFSVESSDNASANLGKERADIFYEELQREKKEQAITRVAIRRLHYTIKNSSDAIWWGIKLDMQIVIWGELKSEKVVIPKFELINFSNTTYGLDDDWLHIYAGAVQPDPIMMGRDLSERVGSITTFTIALSYLVSLSDEKIETNYNKAIQQFDKLINSTSDEQSLVLFLNYRGLIYSFKNDYERAKNDYDEALRINPTHANTFVNLGGWYARQRNYEAAKQKYYEALTLDPEDIVKARAKLGLGSIEAAVGNAEAAIELYEEAIQIQEDYTLAYFLLASVYENRRDFDNAIIYYQKAEHLAVNDPRLREMASNNKKNIQSKIVSSIPTSTPAPSRTPSILITPTPKPTYIVPSEKSLAASSVLTTTELEMGGKTAFPVSTSVLAPIKTPTPTPSPTPLPALDAGVTSPPILTSPSQLNGTQSVYPQPEINSPLDGRVILSVVDIAWVWDGDSLKEDEYFDVKIYRQEDVEDNELNWQDIKHVEPTKDRTYSFSFAVGDLETGTYKITIQIVKLFDDEPGFKFLSPESNPVARANA